MHRSKGEVGGGNFHRQMSGAGAGHHPGGRAVGQRRRPDAADDQAPVHDLARRTPIAEAGKDRADRGVPLETEAGPEHGVERRRIGVGGAQLPEQ